MSFALSSGIDQFKPLAVAAYILALSITPGPNNVMLAASGANFGFLRTLPHLFGITIGATTLVVLSATGLGVVFIEYPAARLALFVIGALYLAYLAFKIANAGRPAAKDAETKPFSFVQAAMFQFVNPKTWLMAANLIVLFSVDGEGFISSVIGICILMVVINFPAVSVWAVLGVGMQTMLQTERARVIYNRTMALLLLACVPLLFWK
ncbi:LysE family translocator [Burkholderia sp. BCC1644]|uniref:LysE family translocator n=1 Tax=Burkholderia sp. BCC1644 TaxID=2676293 RepID=UPI00158FA76F|nr:LysE family translocator [Burkholderia sp. BCC1644]